MPHRPKTPCAHPGCPKLVPYGQKYCEVHAREHSHDRRTAAERGYDRRWQKARAWYLRRRPWCVRCKAEGRLTPATVVDHIKPHRGDPELFWDEKNWQPLCKSCHDKKTMTEDRNLESKY